ncbi:MAG: hypothetical protein C4320_09880 [Armatimonadota bacterium]
MTGANEVMLANYVIEPLGSESVGKRSVHKGRVVFSMLCGQAMAKPINSRKLKFYGPILDAIRELGGSATPAEVRERVLAK